MENNLLIKYKIEIGLVICMFGVQYSRVLMELFSLKVNISNAVLIIGLLLTVHYDNLVAQKFKGLTRPMIALIMYQLIVGVAALLSGRTNLKNSLADPIYTWYTFVFISLLTTVDKDKINGEAMVSFGWWTSGISSVIVSYLATEGFRTFNNVKTLSNGGDRLTLSVIAFAFLIFTLLYEKNTIIKKLLSYVFIASSVICITVLVRKGMMVSYIIIFVFHYFRKGYTGVDRMAFVRFLVFVLGIVVLAVAAKHSSSAIFQAFNYFTDHLLSALRGYFGLEVTGSTMYNSGAIRNNTLTEAWKAYTTDTNAANILFGRGYYYKHLDVPYLEIFVDMGLFVGIYYLVLQLILPVRYFFVKGDNKAMLFIQYYSIVVITQNMYSGVPYGHYKFIPIAILYLFCTEKKKWKYGIFA